ncbi:TVP38/TMEM64 family protein [Aureivirga sp. CE67]|uniref:TVP38/TMEM64 family protein n=1 Tax=Aureivirga sp. CE67 TaxID=1788983 RepID=UPI0018CA5E9B|nr:VTT domain-containing protein [Aureivirga sp. CE67]
MVYNSGVMLKLGRKVFTVLWILVIIYLIIKYLQNPEIIKVDNIKAFVESYGNEMIFIYILLTFVRGFFLIPSTPFVIGGSLLFPDQLFLVLMISISGVLFSATLLYFLADKLGFSDYFKTKQSKSIEIWKTRLKSPKAIYFVIGWSFFPFVPTDVICYVAGLVKMPFKYMITGVFIGELVLDVFYIYFDIIL